MTLEDIVAGRAGALSSSTIGGNRALVTQMQGKLESARLLEPLANGGFRPVSQWVLGQFLRKSSKPDKTRLNTSVAQALLGADVAGLFALKSTPTLAGHIAVAMSGKGWRITRHPDCVNIVYVEGMNAEDKPNVFGELRLVLRVNRAGKAEIVNSWEATSKPGTLYTKLKKENLRGVARIAFGQYKSWSVGRHPCSKPQVAHQALVQVKHITMFCDFNEDYQRNDDKTYTGLLLSVNQHWGYNIARDNIGNTSADCLVGRTKVSHWQFISRVTANPPYAASHGFRFMTTVMPASDVV